VRTTTRPLFSKRTRAHNNAKHNDDDDDTAADDDSGSDTVTTMAEEEIRRKRRRKIRMARQFTIFTCGASACAAHRQRLGLDEFATYTALYVRANNELVVVPVMETRSCLGACQYGPCVAIGHDEYEGMVALTGMTSAEFTHRVFFHIIDDDDVDRVWQCIVQSIDVMAANDEEEDDEEEEGPKYTVGIDDHYAIDRYV
jgi:(2Fe-2S) ferredoxin